MASISVHVYDEAVKGKYHDFVARVKRAGFMAMPVIEKILEREIDRIALSGELKEEATKLLQYKGVKNDDI
jgi:hypothetical protein